MDEKTKSEVRRKKVLMNAEARLRFIKEGIPWRSDEQHTDSSVDFLKNEELEHTAQTLSSQELQNDQDTKSHINETGLRERISSSDVKKVINENITRTSQSENVNQNEIIHLETNPQIPNDCISEPQQNTDDPFKVLKTLLNESSQERMDQKQRNSEVNRNIWINCFIMALLGVVIRISYDMGISWIFNEMMLVPFVLVGGPRLVSLVMEPPPPSGSVLQVLIMAGIKIQVIKKAFNLIFILRAFLQLFSVYLISFIFTHQIVSNET